MNTIIVLTETPVWHQGYIKHHLRNPGINITELFCDHRKVVHYRTDLVRQDDGSWKTVHKWKCKKCGKVIRNDNI